MAIVATAASAEESGKLDEVEDELFRFGRILDANPELREALSDRAGSIEGKRSLLSDVLGRKVSKVTKDLLDQVVVGRHGTPARGIAHVQRVLAARHERLLATAWVATDLNAQQRTRMTKALSDRTAARSTSTSSWIPTSSAGFGSWSGTTDRLKRRDAARRRSSAAHRVGATRRTAADPVERTRTPRQTCST